MFMLRGAHDFQCFFFNHRRGLKQSSCGRRRSNIPRIDLDPFGDGLTGSGDN